MVKKLHKMMKILISIPYLLGHVGPVELHEGVVFVWPDASNEVGLRMHQSPKQVVQSSVKILSQG